MRAKTLRHLIVVGLIVLWELLPRTGLIPELFLPSLSSTLLAGVVMVAAIAITFNELIRWVETRCSHWRT